MFHIEQTILKENLKNLGFHTPTSIQKKSIPVILSKKSVMMIARTGSGKTAAFTIPMIEDLLEHPEEGIKAIILVPTRELAIQVRDQIRGLIQNSNLKCSVIFGGSNQESQKDIIKKGVDIIVATPGRLLELCKQKKNLMKQLRYFMIDEVDMMLKMDFIHDIKHIKEYMSADTQMVVVSATMDEKTKELASSLMNEYEEIVDEVKTSTVIQKMYQVNPVDMISCLIQALMKEPMGSCIIFTNTKETAVELSKLLNKRAIANALLHSDQSAKERMNNINQFKSGKITRLVATDIASRGLDVVGLTHVIHYEFPTKPDVFLHRNGRVGRNGMDGTVLTFGSELEQRKIEKMTKSTVTVVPFKRVFPKKKKKRK